MASDRRTWVYGVHAVRAVLERSPERVLELFIAAQRDDARMHEVREAARALGLAVQEMSAEQLLKRTGSDSHQGVAASIRPQRPWDEHALARALDPAAGSRGAGG
ncbi:MAG TPA: RNA methyltransferase substrate-binding domain-containing protein, partial [Steroidobacteraceae bacterium]|nr:RNA methyltransferase substrate-binding domain-containing protein [Steroidobacteraceae bacterium]